MQKKSKTKPKVLFMITGCAQAEVAPRMVYNLLKNSNLPEIDLQVVASESSLFFFKRKELEKILGKKIFVHHTDGNKEVPVPHISLAEWADLILIYPASANTMAKCAHGFTDTLVSNIVLSARCPIYFGPTMNDAMMDHPLTRQNMRTLKKLGYRFIPSEEAFVKVRATGKVLKKMYISERSVLKVVQKHFG